MRLVSASGDTVWASISSSVVRDSEGEPQMRLLQMLDISERKRFEGQLQHLADHDPLTGLINRRRFEEELERELTAAKRYDRAGAVLVLDLDNFKYVNDTHGHSAGDDLIVSVSALLRRRLRESDTLSRIGGDEFAVILPDCSARQAEIAANGLLGTLRGAMLEQHRGGRSQRQHRGGSLRRRPARSPARSCWWRPTWRCTRPRSAAATGWRSSSATPARPARSTAGSPGPGGSSRR